MANFPPRASERDERDERDAAPPMTERDHINPHELYPDGFARQSIVLLSKDILARLLGLPDGTRVVAVSDNFHNAEQVAVKIEDHRLAAVGPGQPIPNMAATFTRGEVSVRQEWDGPGSSGGYLEEVEAVEAVVRPDADKLATLLFDAASQLRHYGETATEEGGLISRLVSAATELYPSKLSWRDAAVLPGWWREAIGGASKNRAFILACGSDGEGEPPPSGDSDVAALAEAADCAVKNFCTAGAATSSAEGKINFREFL